MAIIYKGRRYHAEDAKRLGIPTGPPPGTVKAVGGPPNDKAAKPQPRGGKRAATKAPTKPVEESKEGGGGDPAAG